MLSLLDHRPIHQTVSTMKTELFASKTANRIAELLTEQTPLITRRQLVRFLQAEGRSMPAIKRAIASMIKHDLIRREVRNTPPLTSSLRTTEAPLWQSGWGMPSLDEGTEIVAYVKAFNALAFEPTPCLIPTPRLLGLYGKVIIPQPSIATLPAVLRLNEVLMKHMQSSILARATWRQLTNVCQIPFSLVAFGGACVINESQNATLLLALNPVRTGDVMKLIQKLTELEVSFELY
jgi:hypothetical protein